MYFGLVEKKTSVKALLVFWFRRGALSVGWGKALRIGPRFNDESMGWVNVP